MRRLVRGVPAVTLLLVALAAAVIAVASWWSSQRAPLPPTLEGPCRVRAIIDPGGTVIDPSRSGGVYAVPLAGTVRYDASIAGGTDPGPRLLQGSVRLDLPPPLADVTLAEWNEVGALPANQGTRSYALAERWAPVGLTVRILAEHREPQAQCAGSLTIRIDGSPFGSALRPLLVGSLVLASWLIARNGLRPRPRSRTRDDPWAPAAAASDPSPLRPPASRFRGGRRATDRGRGAAVGAGAGALYGLSFTCLLLLSGALPLGSAWVLVVPAVGILVGIAWALLAPIARGPGSPAHDDHPPIDGPELVVIAEPDRKGPRPSG